MYAFMRNKKHQSPPKYLPHSQLSEVPLPKKAFKLYMMASY